MLWEGNCVLASSVMIRRECFEALAGFDEDRGLIGVEDYNFWLRATRAGWKVATYQEWLVKYTPAPGSLSRNQSRLMEAELVNAGKLAAQLGIAPDAAQRKRCGILRSYAEDFLFARNMGPARACHWKLVRQQPTVRNLVRAVGVMLPPRILDLRRGRPAPQSQEPATPPPRESGAAAQ